MLYAEDEIPFKWVCFQTNEINVVERLARFPDLSSIESVEWRQKMLLMRQTEEIKLFFCFE